MGKDKHNADSDGMTVVPSLMKISPLVQKLFSQKLLDSER
jgi:hypothetical protein